MKIIYGILNPTSGKIFNNGCSISYIPQERYIFEGTILENITLFNESIDDKIIKKINSLLKILNLKYSLNHLVDKDGKNLSGGEKLKICIARALFRNPSLLILDEPTSALDDYSEDLFCNLLKNINVTTILVTHRKKLMDMSDRILKISDNKIFEINKESEIHV